MKIKLIRFAEGLEASVQFLTIGKVYTVKAKGYSEGSLLIKGDDGNLSEIFEEEYEVVEE